MEEYQERFGDLLRYGSNVEVHGPSSLSELKYGGDEMFSHSGDGTGAIVRDPPPEAPTITSIIQKARAMLPVEMESGLPTIPEAK